MGIPSSHYYMGVTHMKRFIEELAKSNKHLQDSLPTDTESKRKQKELRKLYLGLLGRRALYVSKVEKESRVVTINQAGTHFIQVSYKYFGRDYEGEIHTSITYLSLICGDSRLDIE